MIIQSGLLLLLLMFINSSHCWVIGPALASTEYSKRLQQAQQLRNEKQLAETSETSSFVLTTTTEAETTQETTTTEPLTPKEIHYKENEKKGYFLINLYLGNLCDFFTNFYNVIIDFLKKILIF